MSTVVAVVLAVGCVVTVTSAITALLVRGTVRKLHHLTAITSAGAPLVGLALVLANGWGLTSGTVVLVVVLLAGTGPVVSAAIAHEARS